jgi:hypothetical protein
MGPVVLALPELVLNQELEQYLAVVAVVAVVA